MKRRALLKSAGVLGLSTVLPDSVILGEDKSSTSTFSEKDLYDIDSAINLYDIEKFAKAKMDHMAFEYIDSGAADELTVKWNLEAWKKIKLMPRVLTDLSRPDTRLELFGSKLDFPILIAPTAYHKIIHPQGEIATVKGANKARALYVVSSNTTTSIEDIAKEAEVPLWFQLYVQDDREFTKSLVQKVVSKGCKALVLTVDTPVTGTRDRQVRSKFRLPEGVIAPYLYDRGMGGAGKTPEIKKPLTWKDIEWIRSVTDVPVILKGILNPLDAKEAIRAGASGIIVSNHAGRNLDTAPATAEVMPAIADAVGKQLPIILDGGIRRGTDVLKALAMGASAVMIGRPVCFGLGAAGADGVNKVFSILRKEFETAMLLCGRPTLESIDNTLLFTQASQ